eukprot:TRINITY_DN2470_c1_g2_i2.p1 TRINITY_DN2470_c1_g2~~TRINITY_DN2470_c1_g2_i2.p1  ORF type:complete len:618 (+),score=55.64 TRINITY_DN2470_c1_g2_i2:396-2249(+)
MATKVCASPPAFRMRAYLWRPKCKCPRRARTLSGPYRFCSYIDVSRRATSFGSGLKQLAGLQKGDMVGIYASTCEEWVIVEQACNAYSLVCVPLYDTLGPDVAQYIVNQTKLRVVVCQKNKVNMILQIRDQCPSLEKIVEMASSCVTSLSSSTSSSSSRSTEVVSAPSSSLCSSSHADELCDTDPSLEPPLTQGLHDRFILSFEEVECYGAAHSHPHEPPLPDDIATISYTSGTTGQPKGVIIRHRNYIANVAGALSMDIQLGCSDVYLSYLPLAHAFERIIHILIYGSGAKIGFWHGDVRELFRDIQELRPTVFASVPRLFNRLYEKVLHKVQSNPIKATLFSAGMAMKSRHLHGAGASTSTSPLPLLSVEMYRDRLWDGLIFNKIATSTLGGKVRLILTGSAPLSPDVLQFLRICFSCPVHEGYGATECTAISTGTPPGEFSEGQVGAPLPCNEIKLIDAPDLSYYTSSDPPCGEVCVRGPNVTSGYYEDEEKTKAAIDLKGWFHTGDIGSWTESGLLKIIDRKKNIFKLSQGEYLAPEKIESVLVTASYVAQAFVYGDSLQSFLVAVVFPDREALMRLAASMGLKQDLASLCSDSRVRERVLEAMSTTSRKAEV